MAMTIPRSAMLPSELRTSDNGLELIADREGFVPFAYWDKQPKRGPATAEDVETICADLPTDHPERAGRIREVFGVLTIGFGFTSGVQIGDTMTRGEALARLHDEVVRNFEPAVRRAITVPLTQGQFDALVAHAYAYGRPGRDMAAAINAGNWGRAYREFLRFCFWNQGKGKRPTDSLYRFRMREIMVAKGFPAAIAIKAASVAKAAEKLVDGKWAVDWDHSTPIEVIEQRAMQAASVAGLPDDDMFEPDVHEPEAPAPVVLEPPPPVELPEIAAPGNPAPAPEIPVPATPPFLPPEMSGAPIQIPTPAEKPAVVIDPAAIGQGGLKDALRSKRFWGMALAVYGRLVLGANAITTGIALKDIPVLGPVLVWAGGVVNYILGDALLTTAAVGALAWAAGELFTRWGERTAVSPLGTSREVALATQVVRS